TIVHAALQPAIRFEKKDCLDLPPVTYVEREAPLTPQQNVYYKKLRSQMLFEVGDESVTSVNAAVRLNKLLQIASGAVYTDSGEVLEKYRHKVSGQFFSKKAHGMGDLKLGEARKAIRDYKKATGNIPGTAELLMTYVESGTEFTCQYGDIGERFYSSVESALDELATLLRSEARELYPQFSDRLPNVEQKSDCVGWGFHDFIADVVGRLKDELGES
ncbi:MAG: hypothetical protein WCK17_08880, partial [Verrucomicrobiota bacterium]